jgi:hypothetical protein
MRIPTFDNLRAGARESLTRFPFVLLAAVVAAVAGNILVDHSDESNWIRLLLAAQLGIPLMFAIVVKTESNNRYRPFRFVAAAGAVGALVVYGVTLSETFSAVTITRHVQFTIGLHLLVAFAPFTGAGRLNGFWQYNRVLFLRFCLSALYSVVLYTGLTVALLAIDKLLGIEVDEKVYIRLWIVIAAVFNTWIFVGGVPKDILGLEDVTDYTKGLRVFAQYILVPLVVIYLVILTIYLGKVIVTRVWPSGWIGYLVSSVAVVGILAHLLVHPMREDGGSQWVRNYSRWYYAAMIPAVVMLLLAIGKRIDQYGVTENRYLLAVLAVWLAVISVYFVVSRTRNIKLIPITLCGLAFVTSFGPWGAFAVSKQSQMNRLTGILESNHLLVDNAIQPAAGEVSFEDRKEISAVLDYIVTTHGPGDIAPWFGDRWAEIDTFSAEEYRDKAPYVGRTLVRDMMSEMDIEYVSKWNRPLAESDDFYVTVSPDPEVLPLEDADVMVRVHACMSLIEVDGKARTISWDAVDEAFLICAEGDTLTIEMRTWVDELLPKLSGPAGEGTMKPEQARVSIENDRVHAVLHVASINGSFVDGRADVRNMNGMCLIRWKD